MKTIQLTTQIDASPETCFDLARDIGFHTRSLEKSGEEAVDGIVEGLIGPGETVTFRGRHFGLVHEHTSRITRFERPRHFRDEMISGRLKMFSHDHFFESYNNGTRMRDVIEFESPYGFVGRIADALVLKNYLRRLIERRNRELKKEAERRAR
ncbi:MAG TPA: SRPBCC family protein [Aridibacter sp.]|nr:SRPBCC family protein [Aridibacter sp.]